MKKIFSVLPFLAFALVFSTSFASAHTGRDNQRDPNSTKVTNENSSVVCNTISSGSNTGDNSITGSNDLQSSRNFRHNGSSAGSATITTGQARSFSLAGVVANSNRTTLTPQTQTDMTAESSNMSFVSNNVSSGSNTGGNTITGNGTSGITTGNSTSTSAAITIVNSNMTKI